MIEIIREAVDAGIFESNQRERARHDLHHRIFDHLAQFCDIEEGQDLFELEDKVDISIEDDFPMSVKLVSTRKQHGFDLVVGFESKGLSRFLYLPFSGVTQRHDGKYENFPLMFPGERATLAELEDFKKLVEMATERRMQAGQQKRTVFDYTSMGFQRLEEMANV